MNTYIVPICDDCYCPYIVSTSARTLEEAETRIMNKLVNEWDMEVPADWEDFCDLAMESNIYIGEIRDTEEF